MPRTSPGRRPGQEYPAMGQRLRAARRARGMSLRELADRLSVSPSLISQVETGRASPSVNTLYAIANELSISIDDLLFIEADRPARAASADAGRPRDEPARTELSGSPVQRASSRKAIRLASGVTWERLTTESMAGIDFLHVIYEVGGASSPEHEFQRHLGREWGFVLSGRLGVTIGFDDYVLEPGDSVAIDSTTPHRLYTVGDEPAHAIWFVMGRRTMLDDANGSGADHT